MLHKTFVCIWIIGSLEEVF